MMRAVAGALLLLMAASCNGSDPGPKFTRDQLLDPETCKDCHPKHYDEWSASMHAYASRDPVFIAMNKRMQEQAPENGTFCLQCHAPMAFRENQIPNLSDPSTIDKKLQGVTCYFCHNVVDVKSDHFNANLVLANDTIMRGALGDPRAAAAPHGVTATSKWHDPSGIESSQMCGTCHDIKVPSGTMIERTFEEYMMSLSSQPGAGKFNSCSDCHMRPKRENEQAAQVENVPLRKVHSHLFPAVDLPLTPDMPNQDALRLAVEKSELQGCTLSMFDIVLTDWRPGEPFRFTVQLEHIAGHSIPSGSAQDRRLWLELVATDENGQVVLETGRIADGEVEEKPMTDPKFDPQFKPWRDHLIDKNGNETHMFWEAADYKSDLLPYAVNPNPAISHTAERTIQTNRPMIKPPPQIEGWVRLRPMGIDVLQDLVKSGHLDPAIVDKMPTLTMAHTMFTFNEAKQTYEKKSLLDDDAFCTTFQTLTERTTGAKASTAQAATEGAAGAAPATAPAASPVGQAGGAAPQM